MRLVSQIGPDDRLIATVVVGQHDPILDPARLGDLVGVPQWGPGVGGRIMAVQDDLQATDASPLNDPIHECQTAQPLEVGV